MSPEPVEDYRPAIFRGVILDLIEGIRNGSITSVWVLEGALAEAVRLADMSLCEFEAWLDEVDEAAAEL